MSVIFKTKLINTLDILHKIKDIIIIGSEVPNILMLSENINDSDLFVSQDIDIGIPVKKANKFSNNLDYILKYYDFSKTEPSILAPKTEGLLEINLLGIDYNIDDLDNVYIYENKIISFMVFGNLSLIKPETIKFKKYSLTISKPIFLIIEKLLSERNKIKLERDLIVAGLLINRIDINETTEQIKKLEYERKLLIIDNLVLLRNILKNNKMQIDIDKIKKLIGIIKNESNI